MSLALGMWVYDAGRRFAGFDGDAVRQDLKRNQEENGRLKVEVEHLRRLAADFEQRAKIAQGAQSDLAVSVKALQVENSQLKEDLLFFQGVMTSKGQNDGISLHRFQVEPTTLPGEYRYRLLVQQTGKRERDFAGKLQLLANIDVGGQRQVVDVVPASQAGLAFRFYRRMEGVFQVSPGASLRSVEVRIFEQGGSQPKLSQVASVPLP